MKRYPNAKNLGLNLRFIIKVTSQMDRWIDGSMDQWIDGSMDRWIDGVMDQWIDGSIDR
jgi:hypothetical protein